MDHKSAIKNIIIILSQIVIILLTDRYFYKDGTSGD